jgi:hypothetical protein
MCFEFGIGDHIRESIGKGRVRKPTLLLLKFEIRVHGEVQRVDPAGEM